MSAQGPSYPAPRSSAVGAHDRSASAGQPAHGQQAQSRRAPSTSSIASSSGTAYSSARASVSTAAGKAGGMAAHLETTVTKLLVATKQLLEGLTDWSQGRITEEQVSDIYVRLGNCFNAAVAAFTKEGISMRCVVTCEDSAIGTFFNANLAICPTETLKRFLHCCEFAWKMPSTKKLLARPSTSTSQGYAPSC